VDIKAVVKQGKEDFALGNRRWVRSRLPKANEMVRWTISRSIATAYGQCRELKRAAGRPLGHWCRI